MGILALDISKSSCGWAVLPEGAGRPLYGHWQLGSEFTSDGRACMKLHQMLTDLHKVVPFNHLYFEQALTMAQKDGASSAHSDVLIKLIGHAESFADAYALRTCLGIHMASWRRHFIGKMARGTKRKELKEYAMERCRQLGFRPRNDDESDALGLLDYACDLRGFTPAWRINEALRPPLTGAR